MTIYSLDVLLFLFGTSLLFHVQFLLLLPDLHTGFSRGRSGALVFPSLWEFSTVYCDPHSQRLWHSLKQKQMFFWNSLAFSMIQRMLAIWFLVPLPFPKPAWASGGSRFTYCWNWHIRPHYVYIRGFPDSSDSKESACNIRDLGSIPGSGRSPGEGNGYPL